jgi:6-bladed beta-propeller protein
LLNRSGAVLLPFVVGIVAGCGRSSAAPEVVGRDSAGVRIVEAAGTDTPFPSTLSEVRRLGGADSGPAAFSDASAYSVKTDSAGHIYILDSDAFQVQVFDTAGNHIRTLGARGGGPGEFQFPGTLFVTPAGEVNVFDYGKQALVKFSPDGTLLPQFSLQPYGFPQSDVRMSGDTLIFMVPSTEENEKVRVMRLRMISPRDSTELARDSTPTPGMVMFSCVGLNIPPPFSREIAWESEGARVAVSRRVPYVIDIFDHAKLVFSIRRAVPFEEAKTEHVSRLYPEGMTVKFGGGGQCTVSAEDIIAKLGTGGNVPLIRDITFAPDGSMWVERYTFKDETPKVDVFAPNGRYTGTLVGHGIPMGFVGDLVLFPIEDEDTGAKVVGIFRLGKS